MSCQPLEVDSEAMGLKAIPSVVQLPGGIRLEALQFKVREYDESGQPKLFELMPKGTKVDKDGFVMFGDRSQFAYIKR